MPHVRSIGGIFWRLDASGNLTAFDTLGNVLGKFVGQNFSGSVNKGTAQSNVPITSTASATFVHAGVSSQITPQVSGSILVLAQMYGAANNTALDGGNFAVHIKTGTQNPAGGAATTGWTLWAAVQFVNNANTAGYQAVLPNSALVTGQTPGVALTIAATVSAQVGGTFSWTSSGVTVAVEL